MESKHELALSLLKYEIDKVTNGRFVHSLNREYAQIKDRVINQTDIYNDEQIETQIKGLSMKVGVCKNI